MTVCLYIHAFDPKTVDPYTYKGNILKIRVAYWELEFVHHGLQKLWGNHSTSSYFFHQPEVGPLTINPCRNRIRVATHRLHWWRGPCNLPFGHVSFWWKVSRCGGGFFSFFSNLQIYSKIYSSFYCKLALQSVLIRGFQKLFAFKTCLHICVKGHFAGMNLKGSFLPLKPDATRFTWRYSLDIHC